MASTLVVRKEFHLDLVQGLFVHGEVKAVNDGTVKPVLIAAHGFRGHKDWGFWPYVTSWLAERGFYTVQFDFSRIGVKNSGGDEYAVQQASTFSRELADLGAVLERVLDRSLPLAEQSDPASITLLGHSRAGGSSIVFAAEHPEVSAVIAWNGGVSPAPAPASSHPVLREDIEKNKERFNTSRLLASLTRPALLIQGSEDADRLLENHARLRQEAPHHHYVSIQGADHAFGAEHPFHRSTPHLEEALEVTYSFLTRRH
ncbi:alpha/beta hydrolase family protein [Paenibacillus sp. y28]|uniref:alpha/beta hydrolase family protein n=1 Tax=Paenibacillus sp. y28 TaxID=3129110 RepID=UPI0030173317